MKKHYVDIDGYWGVLFIYDFGLSDVDEIVDVMENFGVNDDEIAYAVHVLYGINGGMTISRSDSTMSVVFVGEASSTEQFFDTLAHEIDHVQFAIGKYYGVEEGGEDNAWLQGYITRGITKWLIKDGYICE